ncbi:MAG: hypothetical protein RQ862_08480 [Candidatus Caldarchaeales archaeon]|nr:hypothetical protein [Candidatus Caldarchaeales archaeon]
MVESFNIVAGTYEIKTLNEEVPTTRASDRAVRWCRCSSERRSDI